MRNETMRQIIEDVEAYTYTMPRDLQERLELVYAALESEEVLAEGYADPDTLADYNAGRQHMMVIFKVQGLHTERAVRMVAAKGE